MLAALAMALMFLGSVFPFAAIACPVLASMVLLPVYTETGGKWGCLWYLSVALLSLILTPDKEAAILFCVFGAYPLLHRLFRRLPTAFLRWTARLLYLNVATVGAYALMFFVLTLDSVVQDFGEMGAVLLGGMLLLANVSFAIYALLLDRLEILYHVRLRPKLKL